MTYLMKKIKTRFPAITESREILPVCGQLMTYLIKKRKTRIPAITESREILPVCGQLMTYKEIPAPRYN
jgi:hypothetical protein